MRVLLADDHVPTRAGVRVALEADGFDVCADVGDAAAAVEAAVRLQPDICVLDVQMPGGGIAAAAAIRARAPGTAIVMLTVSDADEDLLASLRAGARGFLSKETNPDRLGAALRGVLAGEAAIPRRLVARLIDEVVSGGGAGPRRDPRFSLTEREWEVLDLLAADATTKEIARRLGVSDVTVRRHVSQVVQKVGAIDRADALRLVRGEGHRA